MQRQSALARPSHISGSQGRSAPSTQSVAARLVENRAEWEAATALDESTTHIVEVLQDLTMEGNVMADGGRGQMALLSAQGGALTPSLRSNCQCYGQLAECPPHHQLVR